MKKNNNVSGVFDFLGGGGGGKDAQFIHNDRVIVNVLLSNY